MTWNVADPLMRITTETSRANQALRDYALLGPGRSLVLLFKRYRGEIEEDSGLEPYPGIPPTRRLATIRGWSVKYQWVQRVSDWELLQEQRREMLWEERKVAADEIAWNMADGLRDKFTKFMDQIEHFIISGETEATETVDGEEVLVIYRMVKLNTNLRELATVAKIVDELNRLSTGQPTQISRLSGATLDSLIEQGLGELADLEHGPEAGPMEPDPGAPAPSDRAEE